MSASSLPTWLLAQIAADEAAAMSCLAAPWSLDETGSAVWRDDPDIPPHLIAECRDEEDGAHIARHNPARVLNEAKALRAIAGYHDGWHICPNGYDDGSGDYGGDREDSEYCWTLRAWAHVFADRAGFKSEWAL